MKQAVTRERNKTYYRVLHTPLWVWVFFILPGNLTYALYAKGPDARHVWWLAAVTAVCAWRGFMGRLPGCEFQPYVTHWGVDQPNLPYRVVCYTAAWIDLLVPFALNALGLVLAVTTGQWRLAELYRWLYFPLAAAIVLATLLDLTPRARRSTLYEGAERAWFYVAAWTVIPAQLAAWAAWRLGGRLGLDSASLAWLRFGAFFSVTAIILWLGIAGRLPRTERYLELARAGTVEGSPETPLDVVES
jgi:hypothetical protein